MRFLLLAIYLLISTCTLKKSRFHAASTPQNSSEIHDTPIYFVFDYKQNKTRFKLFLKEIKPTTFWLLKNIGKGFVIMTALNITVMLYGQLTLDNSKKFNDPRERLTYTKSHMFGTYPMLLFNVMLTPSILPAVIMYHLGIESVFITTVTTYSNLSILYGSIIMMIPASLLFSFYAFIIADVYMKIKKHGIILWYLDTIHYLKRSKIFIYSFYFIVVPYVLALSTASIIDMYCYKKKYNKGIKVLEKEITNLEKYKSKLDQSSQKVRSLVEIDDDDFLESVLENNPSKLSEKEFKENKKCIICSKFSLNNKAKQPCCFKTKQAGDYSFCWSCYENYHTSLSKKNKGDQDYMFGFFKVLTSEDTAHLYPVPYSLKEAKEKKTQAFLTAQDLKKLGASKEIIKNYIDKIEYTYTIDKNACFICGSLRHKTSACNEKKALEEKAKLFALYTGKEPLFRRIITHTIDFFYQSKVTQVLANILFNFQKSKWIVKRPCPYCGFLIDKDIACDHVNCSVCGKEWDWLEGKKKKPVNYSHSLSTRTYVLEEGIIPFNVPRTVGDPFYKEMIDLT